MAVDLRRDPATRTGALRRVGEQLGINPETLRNWVSQAEIDEGHRPGVTTSEAQRIAQLEFAVAEYIDWFNHRRLHGEIGLVPPVEFEEEHYRHNPAPTTVGAWHVVPTVVS